MYFIDNGSDRTETLRARRQSLARFLGMGARLVLEASEDLDRVLGHALGRQKLIGCLNGADAGFMHALELTGLSVLARYDAEDIIVIPGRTPGEVRIRTKDTITFDDDTFTVEGFTFIRESFLWQDSEGEFHPI